MCYFEYKKYDSCGHHGIEVNDYCDEALWMVGQQGKLELCKPELLDSLLECGDEPPKPTMFISYEGFCEMCVHTYNIPHSIPQRSHSDHELNYWNHLVAFDTHSFAPYLLTRGFFAQIPDLLGVADQFEAACLRQGPKIFISRSLEQKTWSELRNSLPFTINGSFEEGMSLSMTEVLELLGLSGGITKRDIDHISNTIRTGSKLEVSYNTLFKARGMPPEIFNRIVQDVRTAQYSKGAYTPKEPGALGFEAASRSQSPTHQDEQAPRALRINNHDKASKLARGAIGIQPYSEGLSFIDANAPGMRARDSIAASTSALETSTASAAAGDASAQGPPSVGITNFDTSMGEELRYHLRKHSFVGAVVQGPGSKEVSKKTPSAAKTAKKKGVPMFVDQAEQQRMIVEQERKIELLRQRQHEFIGSGSGSTTGPTHNAESYASAQPVLGGGTLVAGEQEPARMTANNAMNDGSNLRLRGIVRVFETVCGDDAVQRPHDSRQPHGTQNPARIQGPRSQHHVPYVQDQSQAPQMMQQLEQGRNPATQAVLGTQQLEAIRAAQQQHYADNQQARETKSRGALQSLVNSFPASHPFAQSSGAGVQQPHRGQQLGHPYAAAQQQQHQTGQGQRHALPPDAAQAVVGSMIVPHPSLESFAMPSHPVFPAASGDPQQLAHGLPQVPQSSPLFSQSAFPTFDGPSPSSQGAQHNTQGIGSRDTPQLPASSQEAIYVPESPVNEDEDVQVSCQDAWDHSRASRRR